MLQVDEDAKSAMVTLLKKHIQVNMDCDLSCYPTADGFFHVEYLYSEETMPALNLTEAERKSIMEEEELLEIFETAEEAAEYYLRLCNSVQTGVDRNVYRCSHPKRTICQKIASWNKDKYF